MHTYPRAGVGGLIDLHLLESAAGATPSPR